MRKFDGRPHRALGVAWLLLVGTPAFAFSPEEDRCIELAKADLRLGPDWTVTVEKADTATLKVPGPLVQLPHITIAARSGDRTMRYFFRCTTAGGGMKIIEKGTFW